MKRHVRFSNVSESQATNSLPYSGDLLPSQNKEANLRALSSSFLERHSRLVDGAILAEQRARDAMMSARTTQYNVRSSNERINYIENSNVHPQHEDQSVMPTGEAETQSIDEMPKPNTNISNAVDVVSICMTWVTEQFQFQQKMN